MDPRPLSLLPSFQLHWKGRKAWTNCYTWPDRHLYFQLLLCKQTEDNKCSHLKWLWPQPPSCSGAACTCLLILPAEPNCISPPLFCFHPLFCESYLHSCLMSVKTFKEECEMHWQVPVTIFQEYIESFFLSNVFISELSIQVRWGLHFMLDVIRAIIVWVTQPTRPWLALVSVAHEAMAICPSAPPPSHLPPWFTMNSCSYSGNWVCGRLWVLLPTTLLLFWILQQQICDEVPSSVLTSSFISVARAVWHRDAFF